MAQQASMLDMKIQAFKQSVDQELVKKWNEVYEKVAWVKYDDFLKEAKKKAKETDLKDKDVIKKNADQAFVNAIIKYLKDNDLSISQYEDQNTNEIVYVVNKIVQKYSFKINTTAKVESTELDVKEIK